MRAIGMFLVLATAVGASAEEFHVNFAQGYDPQHFRTLEYGTVGKWEVEPGGLRAVLPAGKVGRPPIRFIGTFHLAGEFEIVARFEINDLPRPEPLEAGSKAQEGANILEIALGGPENRKATVFRCNRPSGEGVGFYVESPEAGHNSKTVPIAARSGRIAVRRDGGTLTFLQGGIEGPLEPIGTAAFGTDPITEVALQAMALSTTDAIDVRFNRLDLRAQEIDWKPSSGGKKRWGTITWLALLHLVALGVGVGVWQWRRARTADRDGTSSLESQGKNRGGSLH